MTQDDPVLFVVGASRGLGANLLQAFRKDERGWIGVSRSAPQYAGGTSEWVLADVANPDGCDVVAASYASRPIGCLIYCAGDWETADLADTPSSEIFRIVSTNLSGFIALCARLRPQLIAGRANVIAIGSISGLENAKSTSAAYVASKHGLRGAVQSLREWFRESDVRITCLSIGSLDEGGEDPKPRRKVPYSDIVDLIKCIRGLSRNALVKDISLPAVDDRSA